MLYSFPIYNIIINTLSSAVKQKQYAVIKTEIFHIVILCSVIGLFYFFICNIRDEL